MAAPLVFLDTETCGLGLDDPIWEVAAVRREPDGTETEYHAFVRHDVAAAEGLPESFRADHDARYRPEVAVSRLTLVCNLLELFDPPEDYRRRAHLVGAVPSFDAERLGRLLRMLDEDIPWHHHLIDVETLAVGAAAARGDRFRPPFESEDVSMYLGVDPAQFERHTAMGDVRWAMAIYDAVMGDA